MGLFDSLIKIKEDVDTWIYKGIDFKKFEKYYEALVCFDKALEINPNSTEAWINKGEVLKKIGRHKEAQVCYDKVLEIDPEYVGLKIMNECCPTCGAELTGAEKFCSICENIQTSTVINKPSKAWYIVPFLFGLIGGIIGYFAIRNKDKQMAQNLVLIGIFMPIISIFLILLIYVII